jgi:hypothetical protein
LSKIRWLTLLEQENERLKRLVVILTIDKRILNKV